jgi:hypothetical protein
MTKEVSAGRSAVRVCLALAGLVFAPAGAVAQALSEPPAALIGRMVAHELQDREQASYWMYHIEKTVDGHTRSQEQVETSKGPIFRVLAFDGHPLDTHQREDDDRRIKYLLDHPEAQLKVKQEHDADEQRVRTLTSELPRAFLYEFDGMEGDDVRLRFKPNPSFVPPDFQSRPLSKVAGTIVIEPHQARLVRLAGHITQDVEFGYGLLGRVDKGGTFSIARQPLTATHWKTRLVDVHVSGRVILLKSISKQQHDVRNDFKPVPLDITLEQAVALLKTDAPPGKL